MDYERLRRDIIYYYGPGSIYFPAIIITLEDIINASNEELKDFAIELGLNLDDYVVIIKEKKQ